MKTFKLTVNGVAHNITADPDTPLLWALREQLGLTGTKYGCGVGVCGACSVILEGDLVRACVVRLEDVAGMSVRTIEGLSKDRSHPVQKAWIQEQAPQCGYCQSGMVMAAVHLLEANPRPTDADIDGITNICRCGTYPRIRRAIHRAAGAKP
ncbi:(2Fe-2S)-binding protein [Phenylobacterium sp. SCN 70-31]|uniref:(2Fe-2S)-binding protein n=1 Tax=Phenylobacterium sp. SCN 70-31 TaxID=1660129 RepID=UPI00086E8A46|nr:(2Fe-2S)-binding protein [Phenylobacterium sp. SCN 70-31]ODT88354.1 MAG: (2Fe-2S)-binding protein [Phenylobacterium sp. SCN 70-31]